MKNQINPVVFSCESTPSGTFNAAELLTIIDDDCPVELAKSLNNIHNTLADYILLDASASGLHWVNMLYDIRKLRDALLKGAGVIEL